MGGVLVLVLVLVLGKRTLRGLGEYLYVGNVSSSLPASSTTL